MCVKVRRRFYCFVSAAAAVAASNVPSQLHDPITWTANAPAANATVEVATNASATADVRRMASHSVAVRCCLGGHWCWSFCWLMLMRSRWNHKAIHHNIGIILIARRATLRRKREKDHVWLGKLFDLRKTLFGKSVLKNRSNLIQVLGYRRPSRFFCNQNAYNIVIARYALLLSYRASLNRQIVSFQTVTGD